MDYVVPDPKAPAAERWKVVFNGVLQPDGFPERKMADDRLNDFQAGRVEAVTQ